MNHWDVQGRLGQDRRADLNREAGRATLVAEARAIKRATRRKKIMDAASWLVAALRSRRVRASGDAAYRRLSQLERDVQ
jgi:hypothetical protein